MREKPVQPARLQKYITFLLEIKKNNLMYNPNCPLTLSEFVKMHEVSSAAPGALEALGFIERVSKKQWRWTDKAHQASEKNIALQLLDHLLHKNKKTVHVPIPDFAGISQSLQTIATQLEGLYQQNRKGLVRLKNGLKSNSGKELQNETDLFRIDDQELFIAGQIASGVYRSVNFCQHEFVQVPVTGLTNCSGEAQCRLCGFKPNSTMIDPAIQNYHITNNLIMVATKDLMNKLRTRDDATLTPAEVLSTM